MSDSDLKEREETDAEDLEQDSDDNSTPEEKDEQQALGGSQDDEDEADESGKQQNKSPGLYRQEGKTKKIKSSSNLKKGLLFGGPMFAIIIFFIVLLLLTGALKAVHFSTILRSTGFASSQFIMREAFSEVAYTDWATQNDTAELPKSKLLDKLRGQDMRKVQKRLTEEGEFKFNVKDGKVTGFDVKGDTVSFDELAKKAGKGSFDELNFREKLSVRKYVTDEVKFKMGDTFKMETRGFRNGFWKGFREATGIKMTRFRDITRDKFGDGKMNEKLNNDETRLRDEYAETRGRGGEIESTNKAVDEAGKEIPKAIDEAAKKGIRLQAKDALDGYLKTKGSDIVKFEQGMSEISTAVFITTLYCMGHDLSHTGDRINQQMELTMARFGHQQQTTKDQIVSGDVTSGDVSFASREWGGDDKTPDAAASPLYQQDIGNDAGNPKLDNAPRMNIAVPFLDWLKPVDNAIRTFISGGLNHAPLIGGKVDAVIDAEVTRVCGVVMNPYAQGAILGADLVISIFTLGTKDFIFKTLQGAAIFAGFAGLGKLIESYINQVAGTGITGNEIGSDRYTGSAISTRYLDSQGGRGTTFAAPETPDEASATHQLAMAQLRDHYNNQGFSERYFAITNPQSLLGLSVARMPTSIQSTSNMLASAISKIGAIFSNAFSMIGSIFTGPKVRAATSDDIYKKNGYFGVNMWGWTGADLEALRSTNLADNAVLVEQRMQNDSSYYSGLEKCYASNRLLSEIAKDSNCKAQSKGTSEPLRDPRAVQWRIYKLHQFGVDQMSSEGLYES